MLWLLRSGVCIALLLAASGARADIPVTVAPVTAKHGMIVAGHPQAVAAGIATLKAGGNAIDAAVTTSLCVGVAEPYGSGLGGKIMLLYRDAKLGRTFVVDGMDAAGSLDPVEYTRRPEDERSYGYGSVCVPGLAAALWAAHQKWGVRPWADAVRPAAELARQGFRVLPKAREMFAEQEKKLRRGDAEIARLYLPGGQLPAVGSVLTNEDLARTLELLAQHGRDGFYRGPVANAIVTAGRKGGGVLTLDDLSNYEARITEPISVEFRGHRIECPPPPASGAALFLPIMKALEAETFDAGPLRTAANLDRIGRVWRIVQPQVGRTIGDTEQSRRLFEKLLAPESIAEIRGQAHGSEAQVKVTLTDSAERSPFYDSAMAATTHFIVVDDEGNIVCATQSQSLHFGAGVVPPGTGVVMNNSMRNFSFADSKGINYVAPGKRPRSTIAPTIVFRGGRPEFAIGIPGESRIPTGLLQALLDRLAWNRPLAEAIGDTRIHFSGSMRREEQDAFEAEASFPAGEAKALQARGWRINLPEPAGTGQYFGGINAVEFNRDGTLTGFADPRRTNAAAGY